MAQLQLTANRSRGRYRWRGLQNTSPEVTPDEWSFVSPTNWSQDNPYETGDLVLHSGQLYSALRRNNQEKRVWKGPIQSPVWFTVAYYKHFFFYTGNQYDDATRYNQTAVLPFRGAFRSPHLEHMIIQLGLVIESFTELNNLGHFWRLTLHTQGTPQIAGKLMWDNNIRHFYITSKQAMRDEFDDAVIAIQENAAVTRQVPIWSLEVGLPYRTAPSITINGTTETVEGYYDDPRDGTVSVTRPFRPPFYPPANPNDPPPEGNTLPLRGPSPTQGAGGPDPVNPTPLGPGETAPGDADPSNYAPQECPRGWMSFTHTLSSGNMVTGCHRPTEMGECDPASDPLCELPETGEGNPEVENPYTFQPVGDEGPPVELRVTPPPPPPRASAYAFQLLVDPNTSEDTRRSVAELIGLDIDNPEAVQRYIDSIRRTEGDQPRVFELDFGLRELDAIIRSDISSVQETLELPRQDGGERFTADELVALYGAIIGATPVENLSVDLRNRACQSGSGLVNFCRRDRQ